MKSDRSVARSPSPPRSAPAAALAAMLCAVLLVVAPGYPQAAAGVGRDGWTLDSAFRQLELSPEDPYLQFVVLQLARRSKRVDDYAQRIDRLLGRGGWRGDERRVDVFDLFTGALAVQESLQLDTMRGRPQIPDWSGSVEVSSLTGPTVQSHPWAELLAGRTPKVSRLSRMVPEDFYLVEFRSVTGMLDVLENGDLWAVHLLQQAAHDATSQDVSARVQQQLAIETHRILRPLYDQVVDRIAICGSDLYVREGSDVTLLFELKQPELFRARMTQFLDNVQRTHPDAVRENGEIRGVSFVHLATPDGAVCVFAADPAEDVHVRSNSKAALGRVLAAIAGSDEEGRPVRRLGETDEFRYIRTLFPYGSADEDGLVYLSDPLIRRIVGPKVKLTEQRRMICYSHLRMIGHAALLYRTEHGTAPASLDALVAADCAPGTFGTGDLACPDGGTYELAEDGLSGACSCHGRALSLTPCSDIPLSYVGQAEADAYAGFLQEYERYWRRYFDPIAIRVRATPERYRLETIVLPLIDNSIYTELAAVLGGEPVELDALPVPTSSIFTLAMKFDARMFGEGLGEFLGEIGTDESFGLTEASVARLLQEGLGDQIALHVCDQEPMFGFSLPQFLGEALGSMRGAPRPTEALWISFLLASLNAPVYLSVPVRDAEIVDGFLDDLDGALARLARRVAESGFFEIDNDFARLPDERGHAIRSASISLGPIKWRLFWSRIGDAVHVASKRMVLRDLMGARPPQASPKGHAMLRLRPEHWASVLQDYQLGWAENARLACLDNLGPLTGVARAFEAGEDGDLELLALAQSVHGTRFYCPELGSYRVSDDGSAVSCSVHGSLLAPRQPARLGRDSELGRLLTRFSGLTATLTFLPEGLHAVLEIERDE